jgi:hypothetical protein
MWKLFHRLGRMAVTGIVRGTPGPRNLSTSWQVANVTMPRRSIAGRLVHGQVWRRHDGRRWIYKKYVENSHRRPAAGDHDNLPSHS